MTCIQSLYRVFLLHEDHPGLAKTVETYSTAAAARRLSPIEKLFRKAFAVLMSTRQDVLTVLTVTVHGCGNFGVFVRGERFLTAYFHTRQNKLWFVPTNFPK